MKNITKIGLIAAAVAATVVAPSVFAAQINITNSTGGNLTVCETVGPAEGDHHPYPAVKGTQVPKNEVTTVKLEESAGQFSDFVKVITSDEVTDCSKDAPGRNSELLFVGVGMDSPTVMAYQRWSNLLATITCPGPGAGGGVIKKDGTPCTNLLNTFSITVK